MIKTFQKKVFSGVSQFLLQNLIFPNVSSKIVKHALKDTEFKG
jgi:hypothetical protein